MAEERDKQQRAEAVEEAASADGPPAGETASVDAGEAATPTEATAGGDAAAPADDAAAKAGDKAEEEEQVEHDLDELLAKARERDEYLSLAQRTQADFENYRKRMARETAAAEQRGVVKLAREVLPAVDDLARALEATAAEEAGDASQLAGGVRLVQTQLEAALNRVGIEGFSPEGERFDPNEHEAMARQPVEGAESGTVVEVYQRGYRFNGTLLRPARVVVAE